MYLFPWYTLVGKMNNDMFKSGNKIPMNISKTPMVETMYVKDDHPPSLSFKNQLQWKILKRQY